VIDTSVRSSNYHARSKPVLGLVLHATAGSFASALSWLTNPHARVSAHYLIDRDGRTLQLVPEELAAWHAGKSAWPSLPQVNGSLNDCTIGIELANFNTGRDPYPEAQYQTCLNLSRAIVARHQIAARNIVRHLDISPGRKDDPRGFPWERFLAELLDDDGERYRARYLAYVRPSASQRKPHTAQIQRGQVVQVLGITQGQLVSNRLGVSDMWAKILEPAGYVWLPQLEAL
jgi:N-acetyl-anhydromuramyl-L-alanine amidase AmpD